MNILFMVLRYPEDKNVTILEKDLVRIFNEKGHQCYVASITERKFKKKSYLYNDGGINVLKVKIGNMFNDVSKIEKGITVFSMPYFLRKQILKIWGKKKIDLIIAYTSYMANSKLIKKLSQYYRCKSLFMLWDIFPQNALDLKMIKENFIYNHFKKREIEMLKTFDYISANSEGNIEYLLKNYDFIDKDKIILARNCEYTNPLIKDFDRKKIRQKYGYSMNDIILVFGGNMGVPQKIENIVSIANSIKENKNVKFLFIGQGTEKEKIDKISKENFNIKILKFFPRNEYEKILSSCDVGIISLNENFTVPNFPAKVTGYCKLGLPIFASLDPAAKNDLGVTIEKYNFGVAFNAGNIKEGVKKLKSLIINNFNRKKMGKNARKYYENQLNIERSYNNIINKMYK